LSMILAPAAARLRAIPNPIPEVDPVTNAVLSFSMRADIVTPVELLNK
jgi:hypothetical protein